MNFETMMNLFSRRGILFPSSEIYDNHPSGFWDYGPYGATIKRKLVELWRSEIVKRTKMIEIDGSICMDADVFRASGHLQSFSDPLIECSKCGSIFRADKLIEEVSKEKAPEAMAAEKFDEMIKKHKIKCTNCKSELGKTRKFNMMFKVSIGASKPQDAYLRPETCQSIFADFPRLIKVMKKSLPLGIAQVGKSFRNEISPRNATIRAREFTQAEAEIFFDPNNAEVKNFEDVGDCVLNLKSMKDRGDYLAVTAKEAIEKKMMSKFAAYYISILQSFLLKCGIPAEKIRNRQLDDEERAFYAKESWDTEIKTSLGWVEIVANNNRTDYDMSAHGKISGKDVSVVNPETNEKFIPHIWEISMGIDRLFYCVMETAYKKDGERVYLSLPAYVAPASVAIFPLINKDGMPEKADEVVEKLKKEGLDVETETKDSIGKRYARADEIGIPFCVTIDGETSSDNSVTIRERDTKKQERVKIKDLARKITELVSQG
ncbi:MAG: glycine--tRNA ligase [Candidatus Aenigmarchaeota archaeon]|nr:glycine--tRNA ligase [Candidatus Aenigmarchaeota archaeon]